VLSELTKQYFWSDEDSAYHAIIQVSQPDMVGVSESILIVVHMNPDLRVESIDVKRIFTGP
jgi:hypothetical protein